MVTRMKKKNKTDAVIHMTVKDDSDFLSVYSVTDTPVISSEVAQFLEHSIQDLIRPDHPVSYTHLTLPTTPYV